MIAIDMEMPENCVECRFDMPDGSCAAMPINFCGHTAYSELERKPEWCPCKDIKNLTIAELIGGSST